MLDMMENLPRLKQCIFHRQDLNMKTQILVISEVVLFVCQKDSNIMGRSYLERRLGNHILKDDWVDHILKDDWDLTDSWEIDARIRAASAAFSSAMKSYFASK